MRTGLSACACRRGIRAVHVRQDVRRWHDDDGRSGVHKEPAHGTAPDADGGAHVPQALVLTGQPCKRLQGHLWAVEGSRADPQLHARAGPVRRHEREDGRDTQVLEPREERCAHHAQARLREAQNAVPDVLRRRKLLLLHQKQLLVRDLHASEAQGVADHDTLHAAAAEDYVFDHRHRLRTDLLGGELLVGARATVLAVPELDAVAVEALAAGDINALLRVHRPADWAGAARRHPEELVAETAAVDAVPELYPVAVGGAALGHVQALLWVGRPVDGARSGARSWKPEELVGVAAAGIARPELDGITVRGAALGDVEAHAGARGPPEDTHGLSGPQDLQRRRVLRLEEAVPRHGPAVAPGTPLRGQPEVR
mmetsp:Transcript_90499/g.292953  ORF Transcript_90499/g.292953 Transcript_90499/m.292953 type:complete len:369 (+) Transcript_90499:661-1767(+)